MKGNPLSILSSVPSPEIEAVTIQVSKATMREWCRSRGIEPRQTACVMVDGVRVFLVAEGSD